TQSSLFILISPTYLSITILNHLPLHPYLLQDILQFRQLPIVYPIYIYFSVESFELLHLYHSLISLPFSKIESIVFDLRSFLYSLNNLFSHIAIYVCSDSENYFFLFLSVDF